MTSALDLSISRVIRAPRTAVWNAWADPRSLELWWVPHPAECRVVELDLKPGGAFVTHFREDRGPFLPHLDACFLAVEAFQRIVFTDSLLAGWRPANESFMTAVITLEDHAEGTNYSAYVMHKSEADRKKHEEMGFFDGWSTVTAQLARFVEGRS